MPAHVDISSSEQAVLVYQESGDEPGCYLAAGALIHGRAARSTRAGQTPTRPPAATFNGSCERGVCHRQDREIVLVRGVAIEVCREKARGLGGGLGTKTREPGPELSGARGAF